MTRRCAFLTGGTGFVGSHVARALCAEGWDVKALSRRKGDGKPSGLDELPIEIVPGDLSAQTDLAASARDCDAIVHVAGLVKARTLEDYREVNLRGTERLLQAAGDSAPRAMFVLVSSQAAAGPARNGRPMREADPARPVSWYGVSKREAEEAVARRWKGPWILLRPGVIFGPGDRGLLGMFRAAARGLMPVPAGRSRIQVMDAEQAALGIARAAGRRDLAGRVGFLCNPEPVTIADFAGAIARLPAKPARLLRVPSLVLRLAGLAESARESLTHRSRPFNADKAREILAGDWLCDAAPLRCDLALPAPAPLENGLRRTWDWYRNEGWIVL